ncbi:MAG: hypothetical protein HY904_00785 [Deltaproteobacteria bacterium]|nr:hypothetical protein [Deltaproteobacteria bacterium]
MLRAWCTVPVGLALAFAPACRRAPPPQPAPLPAGDTCSGPDRASGLVELGRRAAAGEDVVTPDGCSLFDGRLLARGFPADATAALPLIAAAPNSCTADARVAGSQVSFARTDGRWRVTRVRNITQDQGGVEAPSVGVQDDVVRAARCPLPSRRLRSADDAQVAAAWGLAAEALRNVLAGRRGADAIRDETRKALDTVCAAPGANTPAVDGGSGPADDVGPLAASARILAGSLAVFGRAQEKLKERDAELEAARPFARALLDRPPATNLQGACATWRMARDTLASLETPAPAPARR